MQAAADVWTSAIARSAHDSRLSQWCIYLDTDSAKRPVRCTDSPLTASLWPRMVLRCSQPPPTRQIEIAPSAEPENKCVAGLPAWVPRGTC
eukprot:363169-Chlamydomonas_euryale.AAC.41